MHLRVGVVRQLRFRLELLLADLTVVGMLILLLLLEQDLLVLLLEVLLVLEEAFLLVYAALLQNLLLQDLLFLLLFFLLDLGLLLLNTTLLLVEFHSRILGPDGLNKFLDGFDVLPLLNHAFLLVLFFYQSLDVAVRALNIWGRWVPH
jgi:hypothetical protein